MSKYFTTSRFTRAKKNKEDLEKTNPQEPVLKDEDEKFLHKHIGSDDAVPATQEKQDEPAIKITDDGEVKEASKEEQEQAGDSIIVPETQPEKVDEAQDTDTKPGSGDGAKDATLQSTEAKAETNIDTQETDVKPEVGDGAQDEAQSPEGQASDDTTKEKAKAKKAKKKPSMELPSQEEAEAATRGMAAKAEQEGDSSQGGEKRTWASYLPSVRPASKKGAETSSEQPQEQESQPEQASADAAQEADTDKAQEQEHDSRTWPQKATAYVPTIPAIPASWRPKSRDKDSHPDPVYNEDGTINTTATQEKEEREVSVLLDNLNMSSINNRVFAMSAETQHIYARFAQVLKDIVNGVPTAYDDMDALMKDAGPKLEEQFQNMPPFVQTLVKSLPLKLGSTLGPELMAAASEKPGADMKARMEAASKPGAGGASDSGGINIPATEETETAEDGSQTKKKGKIPGLKSLVSSQSGVTTMLRSVVNFLTTRFPFLASGTNVVMSLAVFILMFVFWYCHKRGKEVRLAREAAEAGKGGEAGAAGEAEDSDALEVEVSDDDDAEKADVSDDEEAEELPQDVEKFEKEIDEKADVLGQPDPKEVPLPDQQKEAKQGAEVEAEKATGV